MGRIGRTYPPVGVPQREADPSVTASTPRERPLVEDIAVRVISLVGIAVLIAWAWRL
jgi:hypothetical protein